jgi:hypothetical protein
VILRAAKKVRELEAAGKIEPTFVDTELDQAVERFTTEVERLAARDNREDERPRRSRIRSSRSYRRHGGEAA